MPAWAARAAARVFLTSDRGVWAGNARCRPNFFAARRHDDRNEAARSVEWTRAVVRSKNGFELRKIAVKWSGFSEQEIDEDGSSAWLRALLRSGNEATTADLISKNPRRSLVFAGRGVLSAATGNSRIARDVSEIASDP